MMKNFKKFLTEKEAEFDHNPKIGWWEDSGDHHTLYHGTHKRNIPHILKHGLTHKDPSTGMISLTHDPHTAHGYAAMSAAGGERHFRGTASKAKTTPHEDRVVLKFKIPKEWISQHIDPHLRGNIGTASTALKDKNKYMAHAAAGKNDHEHYAMSEIRVNKEVPPEFIHSYAHKVKKK